MISVTHQQTRPVLHRRRHKIKVHPKPVEPLRHEYQHTTTIKESMTNRATEQEIAAALETHSGWTVLGGKLHKDFEFPDFVHAFGFMATAAIAIERMNHHPEWFNVYNRVAVDLTTHDAGGISKKDFELAALLDSLAA